jgi:hypothetical protein
MEKRLKIDVSLTLLLSTRLILCSIQSSNSDFVLRMKFGILSQREVTLNISKQTLEIDSWIKCLKTDGHVKNVIVA